MTSISNLEVDEALLTGEAMPVAKIVESLGASSSHGLPRVPTFSTEGENTLAPGVGLESREQIAVEDFAEVGEVTRLVCVNEHLRVVIEGKSPSIPSLTHHVELGLLTRQSI